MVLRYCSGIADVYISLLAHEVREIEVGVREIRNRQQDFTDRFKGKGLADVACSYCFFGAVLLGTKKERRTCGQGIEWWLGGQGWAATPYST